MIRSLISSFFIATSAFAVDFKGQFTQGGFVTSQVTANAKVSMNGQSVPVTPDGRFALGFGRDFPESAKIQITYPNGDVDTFTRSIAKRDYKIQRINGLPPKKVNVPPERLKRIRAESKLVREARAQRLNHTDFLGPFIWPTKGTITGVYGSQRVLNGEPRRPHFGIDVAAPTGTPVKAPAGGTVTMSHNDMYFSGGTLLLDHGYGVNSAFLHLDEILVKEGDVVKQGDVIATVGATGRVTGPHLDWRMNWLDQRIDPQLLVEPITP